MSSSSKMILLKSSDGETFELEESVALQSKTIEHMIEDGCAGSVIPTPNITGKILLKAANYLNIQTLLKLTCKTVGDMTELECSGITNDLFNIKNDLTPEEEEQIRIENAWAFNSDDMVIVTTPALDEQTQDEQT
ncbi:S-phase kinase-associated protein 1-like, SKP1/BTB/POZ domain protein [Tanacetum coccineum]